MKIIFFGKTDVGRVRHSNEDFFTSEKINDKEFLFIIADGMGGHQAGEVASKLGTTTFVNEYKKHRKKGEIIKDAMTQSLKKANSIILKRAMSDPQKRGMGTTFTGCVISDKKATIIHIGDSRIYFIRDNKIKRITTDHTFVEKMLKEGKITEEEARDHPQKNILYMSLGARKTYAPQIINNLEIKSGDIITMCSDGLNNMVDNGSILEYSLAYNPEKSVRELINLANNNGGIDNITIQIIHIGKVLNKNKTQPLNKVKTKRKKIAFSLSIGIFSFLFFIWLDWYGNYSNSAQENKLNLNPIYNLPTSRLKNLNSSQISQQTLNIQPFKVKKRILSPQHFFSLSQGKLLIKKKNELYLFDVNRLKLINQMSLKSEQQIIPTNLEIFSYSEKSGFPPKRIRNKKKINLDSYYILKKLETKSLKYKLITFSRNKTLLTILSDNELNSINHESRTLKLANLASPLTPIFIDKRAFIFNDKDNYYVIENPLSSKNGELRFYKINDFGHHADAILSLKVSQRDLKIIYFDSCIKVLSIFEVTESKLIFSQKISIYFSEKPIIIEYFNHSIILFYFSDHYVVFKNGTQILQSSYKYNDEKLFINTIVIDSTDNQRIISDVKKRVFKLNFIYND